MTYNDLKASAPDFGAEAPFLTGRYLGDYNREPNREPALDITDLWYDAAKAQILLDLQERLGLDPAKPADMERIDCLVDGNQSRMRLALACLQIAMSYDDMGGPEGSLNQKKHLDYAKRYREMKGAYATLGTSRPGAQTRVMSIRL